MVNLLVALHLQQQCRQRGLRNSRSPRCSWCTTQTRPSISSVPSTPSTQAIRNGFGRGIRGAFEQSNELVLETLLPEGPDAAQEINRAIERIFGPSAYFLTTTRTAINAGRSQGMKIDNGADTVLRHIAEAEGKYVQGLETLQLQFNMFKQDAAPAQVISGICEARSAGTTQQDVSAAMNAMEVGVGARRPERFCSSSR